MRPMTSSNVAAGRRFVSHAIDICALLPAGEPTRTPGLAGSAAPFSPPRSVPVPRTPAGARRRRRPPWSIGRSAAGPPHASGRPGPDTDSAATTSPSEPRTGRSDRVQPLLQLLQGLRVSADPDLLELREEHGGVDDRVRGQAFERPSHQAVPLRRPACWRAAPCRSTCNAEVFPARPSSRSRWRASPRSDPRRRPSRPRARPGSRSRACARPGSPGWGGRSGPDRGPPSPPRPGGSARTPAGTSPRRGRARRGRVRRAWRSIVRRWPCGHRGAVRARSRPSAPASAINSRARIARVTDWRLDDPVVSHVATPSAQCNVAGPYAHASTAVKATEWTRGCSRGSLGWRR